MKKFIMANAIVLALTGCASIQYAGTAAYSIKPFTDETGKVICCAVDVKNGKEIANLEAHVSKQGDDYTVDLKEQGVAAFAGQAIAAGATKEAIDGAVKAALAVALAPAIPALGASLAAPGLGAAIAGGAGVLGAQKLLAPK